MGGGAHLTHSCNTPELHRLEMGLPGGKLGGTVSSSRLLFLLAIKDVCQPHQDT